MRLRDDDNELGYVAIGIEGPNYRDVEGHFALTVAKEIIGSWDRNSSMQISCYLMIAISKYGMFI